MIKSGDLTNKKNGKLFWGDWMGKIMIGTLWQSNSLLWKPWHMYPLKMVIFNSYVKSPKGNHKSGLLNRWWTQKGCVNGPHIGNSMEPWQSTGLLGVAFAANPMDPQVLENLWGVRLPCCLMKYPRIYRWKCTFCSSFSLKNLHLQMIFATFDSQKAVHHREPKGL